MSEDADADARAALAHLIVSGHSDSSQTVVFITGAGLSAASGVPVFRGGDDSVWGKHAIRLATRKAFLQNPVTWYNSFWFKAFPERFTKAQPNAGHEAIAALASDASSPVRCITQNIDALHQQTVLPWDSAARLVEIHGRLGLYRCSNSNCPMGWENHYADGARSVFPEEVADAIEAQTDSRQAVLLEACPTCRACEAAVMPLALLFDEAYESHAFYQFSKAKSWIESATAIVFVGTSFNVNITNIATQSARQRRIPVFNINTKNTVHITSTRRQANNVYNIIGRAEETLAKVAELVSNSRA